MTHLIHEANWETCQSRLEKVMRRCKKLGCEFSFEVVGEEFKKVDGEINRFIVIEAEGHAVINGWKFVATVDHTEAGNIIRCAPDQVAPDKYRTADPVCDHCKSARHRKETFIVQHEDGTYMQVGRSCLKDFTNGMSAEGAVALLDIANLFEEMERSESLGGGSPYFDTKEFLEIVAECVRLFGYTKTGGEGLSTKQLAQNIVVRDSYTMREIEDAGFKFGRQENKDLVEAALYWAQSIDPETTNDYMHNLLVASKLEFINYKNFGVIASLIPAYHKATTVAQEKKKLEENPSAHVGTVGQRINLEIDSVTLLTSWNGQYGMTYLYKMMSGSNVFIWFASTTIGQFVIEKRTGVDRFGNEWEQNDSVFKPFEKGAVKATIKGHDEREGVKQTILTRVKVV